MNNNINYDILCIFKTIGIRNDVHCVLHMFIMKYNIYNLYIILLMYIINLYKKGSRILSELRSSL